MNLVRLFSLFACLLLFTCCESLVLGCQTDSPATLEAKAASTSLADRLKDRVRQAIETGDLPGCVLAYGNRKEVQSILALGNRESFPEPVAMTPDTVFDLASLTKPLATATAVMLLVDQGKLDLQDTLAKHLPGFGVAGKETITLQQALVHQSGLIADNPLADYRDGPAAAWKNICQLKLVDEVGTRFRYSDVNFIVLGKLVEEVSGETLDQFTKQHLFQPLGMNDTGYLPNESLRLRAAPTERRNDQWMRGEVHDPRAFALRGVAGHAGVFSTADDLALYAQAALGRLSEEVDASSPQANAAAADSVFPLSPTSLRIMTAAHAVSRGTRGLGWDKQSPYSSNRSELLSPAAFGHGGVTGTVFWIDPDRDFFFIFLSSRLYPDGEGAVNRLAAELQTMILQAGP